ncbi:MAG: glucosamine-6-phosphate deaminase [Bacteroidota bacterium]|nr:glucosamine-6-phosphate deaminase [Bacteroidota bacterium]
MQIRISDSYQIMSKLCVTDLLDTLEDIKEPLICTASGDTPKGMYEELVKQVREKNIDISNWHFISLDEWEGMNGKDEGSCRYHLDNQLFRPLEIADDKIIFFDGRSKNLQAECDGIEDYINLMGGIDVAILGLGMNGHIGMNEPGTPVNSYSHIADIDEMTQTIGQKYFTEATKIARGLTLGIGTLREAYRIMLLATGSKKSEIVLKVLGEDATNEIPATLITDHEKICVYLDKEAAPLALK